MRKLATGVYYESRYAGVDVGLVVKEDDLFLVDCPLRIEESKEWLSTVSERGVVRYLALLDAHPDRVLGSRTFDVPLLAHDHALAEIREWSDTFKGNQHPIGAEADRLKRVTGIHRSVPDLSFSKSAHVNLKGLEIQLEHHPGPQAGSIWVLIPSAGVVFVGDCVTLSEPPYLGAADLTAWQKCLDCLRDSSMESFTVVSAYGGPLEREHINSMARFLRKVEVRVGKLEEDPDPESSADRYAAELLEDFTGQPTRSDMFHLRLKMGLLDLFEHIKAGEA
jgi:glyoxylase-like metal-dependent hydrolase (beta-lactamase superfamily II)